MGVIPMGEHYKSIFLSVIILAGKLRFSLVTEYTQTRIDRPHQTAIRFLLFRIPTIQHPERCMLTVLRINNIIGNRAAPEFVAKLGSPFQKVRRYLGKRAVFFYELHAVSPQALDEVLTRHFLNLHVKN